MASFGFRKIRSFSDLYEDLNLPTGLDEFGERIHNSMYNDLWTNSPFEINEYPDYTMFEHFKRPYPSHPPRAVCREYIEGLLNLIIGIDIQAIESSEAESAMKHWGHWFDFQWLTVKISTPFYESSVSSIYPLGSK